MNEGQVTMTDKQIYTCLDCKHHIYEETWDGEEEFIYSECELDHETSPFCEIECEVFEYDR